MLNVKLRAWKFKKLGNLKSKIQHLTFLKACTALKEMMKKAKSKKK